MPRRWSPRPVLELVRLPNIFTAWADVAMGFLLTRATLGGGDAIPLAFLIAATTCLYWGGMALNDLCDVDTDRAERPNRPLPSMRVSIRFARRLTVALFTGGLLAAAAASFSFATPAPLIVAILLAACIVAYDAGLKRGALGPVAMGTCRALNILLGMLVTGGAVPMFGVWVALAMGVYIAGLTWWSRTETRRSARAMLLAAGTCHLVGGAMLLGTPWLVQVVADSEHHGAVQSTEPFFTVVSLVLLYLTWGVGQALRDPGPRRVQAAVQRGILALILLDAALVGLFHGAISAALIAGLLVPAVGAARWLYST